MSAFFRNRMALGSVPQLDPKIISILNDPTLVAYYRFENNLNDSKSAYPLTQYGGGLTYDVGKSGQAVKQNSYLNYARYNAAVGGIDGGPLTFSIFVKDRATRSAGVDYGFISYVNTGTKTRYGIGRTGTAGANLFFGRDTIGGGGTVGTITVPYSTYINTSGFSCLVLTYDGTNVNAFINGVKVGTVAASGNGVGWSGSVTGLGVGIFQGWAGWDTAYTADALYDNVLVFNRALSEAEAISLSTINYI